MYAIYYFGHISVSYCPEEEGEEEKEGKHFVTSLAKEIMFLVVLVCLPVCKQYYSKKVMNKLQ